MFEANYERNLSFDLSFDSHYGRLEKIGKALSAEIRLKMLHRLHQQSWSVTELAEHFAIPVSSAAFHLNILKEAGLILSQNQSGKRGLKTVSTAVVDTIAVIILNYYSKRESSGVVVEMPVGGFYECLARPSCGMADENGIIENMDNPKIFYSPLRSKAQLIWFQEGSIEYRFPNNFACVEQGSAEEISFSLEICSEISGFADDWPSDIHFHINGILTASYTSPGDFGRRRGFLTPDVWPRTFSQHGLLKTITVNTQGTLMDGLQQPHSPSLKSLQLASQNYISFKIEAKEKNGHRGGLNIFGAKYGDFPQHIMMRLH